MAIEILSFSILVRNLGHKVCMSQHPECDHDGEFHNILITTIILGFMDEAF